MVAVLHTSFVHHRQRTIPGTISPLARVLLAALGLLAKAARNPSVGSQQFRGFCPPLASGPGGECTRLGVTLPSPVRHDGKLREFLPPSRSSEQAGNFSKSWIARQNESLGSPAQV